MNTYVFIKDIICRRGKIFPNFIVKVDQKLHLFTDANFLRGRR